jgi:hypothetical protein
MVTDESAEKAHAKAQASARAGGRKVSIEKNL